MPQAMFKCDSFLSELVQHAKQVEDQEEQEEVKQETPKNTRKPTRKPRVYDDPEPAQPKRNVRSNTETFKQKDRVVEYAKKCIKLGLIPLPIGENNKASTVPGFNKLVEGSIELFESSKQTFTNMSLLTGQYGKIMCLDIDMKDQGVHWWKKLVAIHGEPDTASEQTPSGGYHYFFRYSPELSHQVGCLKVDGETIGWDLISGGQITCWPSLYSLNPTTDSKKPFAGKPYKQIKPLIKDGQLDVKDITEITWLYEILMAGSIEYDESTGDFIVEKPEFSELNEEEIQFCESQSLRPELLRIMKDIDSEIKEDQAKAHIDWLTMRFDEDEDDTVEELDVDEEEILEQVANEEAAMELMKTKFLTFHPNATFKKEVDKGAYTLLEFKDTTLDTCRICSRKHSGNNTYMVYVKEYNRGYYKCHDSEARGKRMLVYGSIYKPVEGLDEFLSYKKLMNRKIKLDDVKQWALNNIVEINAGKVGFLTKHQLFNEDINVAQTVWMYVDKKDLLDGLDKEINIIDSPLDKKKQKIFRTIKDCVSSFMKKAEISMYKQTRFAPYFERNPVNQADFNTFTGYPIMSYKPRQRVDFTETFMYKHIRDVLCNGDEAGFKWFCAWIGHLIVEPATIPGTAVMFHSGQGTGKDTMSNFLKNMIGGRYHLKYSAPEQALDSQFNDEQEGKLLILFNELSDNGRAVQKIALMNEFITRDKFLVNGKGRKKYETNHCARYMFFTNNDNCLHIAGNDRRYTIFKCNDKQANDPAYFANLRPEVTNKDILHSALHWFAGFYKKASLEERSVSVYKCHATKYKDDMKVNQMSTPLRFLVDYVNNSKTDIKRNKKGLMVLNKVKLYAKYDVWCVQSNEQAKNKKTFYQILESSLGLVEQKFKMDGETVRGYRYSLREVEEKYREHLKMPDFCLENDEDTSDESDDSDSE